MKYGWCGSLLPTRVRAAVLKHTKWCTKQHSSPWIGLILALLLRCLISAGLLHWSHQNLDCTTSAPKTVVLTMVAPPPNHVTTPAGHTIAVNQRNMQYKHPAKFQRLDLEMLMRTLNSNQAGIAWQRFYYFDAELVRSYSHSRCLLRCRTSRSHTQHSVSKIKKNARRKRSAIGMLWHTTQLCGNNQFLSLLSGKKVPFHLAPVFETLPAGWKRIQTCCEEAV